MINRKLNVLSLLLIALSLFINNASAQLKSNYNSADYIIITPSQFVETLEPFIEWRGNKGYDIKVAELDDVYSEFPDSTNSSSIRDFVSYALTYWSDPKPQYILLVGGEELLPSNKVESELVNNEKHDEDSVLVDEWYVINKYNSTFLPEAAIGRAPVYSINELENFINKTIYFEDSLSIRNYKNSFTVLTDKKDSAIFEARANEFLDNISGYNYSPVSIFAGQDSTVDSTKNKLINGINKGTFFLTYFGHGAEHKWSKYDLFTLSDIDSLKENSKPFILTTAACSQSFYASHDSSLVRNLIVANNKGSVASITGTGLGFLSYESAFIESFFNYILTNNNLTLGEAVLNVKLDINSNRYFSRLYTLLGDPALKLPLKTITQIADTENEISTDYILNQNYPNPFNPTSTITFSLPQKDDIQLIVYDILGREVERLADGVYSAGTHEFKFNASNLSSGVYLYCLKTSANVITKKMMLLK